MIVVAIGVKLTSQGPVLSGQRRPGKNGSEFDILKFRTMVDGATIPGPVLTRAADPRVTWFGPHIRKWKLEEFPQLFNVLRGAMSFAGPRPHPTNLRPPPSIHTQPAYILSVPPLI